MGLAAAKVTRRVPSCAAPMACAPDAADQIAAYRLAIKTALSAPAMSRQGRRVDIGHGSASNRHLASPGTIRGKLTAR